MDDPNSAVDSPVSNVAGDPTPTTTEPSRVPEASKKSTRTAGGKSAAKDSATGRGGSRAPHFAPKDLTDGREPLEWETNYKERTAKIGIWGEATYLAFLFVLIPVCLLLVWQRSPAGHFVDDVPRMRLSQTMTNYLLAWIGGTLGGILFSTKWLYHSVAKKIWHADRRLWRLFTPHLSGALAFATYVMVTCGLLPIVEKKSLETEAMALSFGFVVGYFSDSATAKLTEVAETLFGSNRK